MGYFCNVSIWYMINNILNKPLLSWECVLVMCLHGSLGNLHSLCKSGFEMKISVIKGCMVTPNIIESSLLCKILCQTQEQYSAAEYFWLKAILQFFTSAYCSQRQPYLLFTKLSALETETRKCGNRLHSNTYKTKQCKTLLGCAQEMPESNM